VSSSPAQLLGVIRCDLPGAGHALFTTRARGNLSTMRGERHQHGHSERQRLARELQLDGLSAGLQVHGNVVARVGAGDRAGEIGPDIEADGQATAVRTLGMTVLVADCLPVLLGSPQAVVALHAGWRGLVDGVLEEGMRAMRQLGGSDDIAAVIGPGAGVCCYEVGEEVHARLGSAHRRGTCADLKAVARERLLAAGACQVSDLELCTICDQRFFSHRREGARAGRQAGIAWLS